MGIGIHITDGKNVFEYGYVLPEKFSNTNNIAEYLAITEVLNRLLKKENCTIDIFGDSQLVVKQLNDEWGANGGAYLEYMYKAKNLLKALRVKNEVNISWIPREKNELADIQSKRFIKTVKKWK